MCAWLNPKAGCTPLDRRTLINKAHISQFGMESTQRKEELNETKVAEGKQQASMWNVPRKPPWSAYASFHRQGEVHTAAASKGQDGPVEESRHQPQCLAARRRLLVAN